METDKLRGLLLAGGFARFDHRLPCGYLDIATLPLVSKVPGLQIPLTRPDGRTAQSVNQPRRSLRRNLPGSGTRKRGRLAEADNLQARRVQEGPLERAAHPLAAFRTEKPASDHNAAVADS